MTCNISKVFQTLHDTLHSPFIFISVSLTLTTLPVSWWYFTNGLCTEFRTVGLMGAAVFFLFILLYFFKLWYQGSQVCRKNWTFYAKYNHLTQWCMCVWSDLVYLLYIKRIKIGMILCASFSLSLTSRCEISFQDILLISFDTCQRAVDDPNMLSVFSSLRNCPHSAWARTAWPHISCWVGQLLTHYSQQMNCKQLVSYCDQHFWLFYLMTCSHQVPKTLSSICHVVSMLVTQVSSVSCKQGGLSVQNHVNSKNKIQTQQRFKRIAIYSDKAQRANFQGNPLYQYTTTQLQTTVKQWTMRCRTKTLSLISAFGWAKLFSRPARGRTSAWPQDMKTI